jgi:tetraacyldisaccharide 4'-kinase
LLHLLYSQLARSRRRYYERRPHLRRRLKAPVISIGNLTVGGSGKTPLAAEVAKTLVEHGERPSILSRGYRRRLPSEGVVIVSDGERLRTDVDHAGDEPFMLARAVPGAAVLVCGDRYLAGRLAEMKLGSTVHILDDGFQHFPLMRDVDLLVAPDEIDSPRTLPFGRFRETLDAARAASALLVSAENGADVGAISDRLQVRPAFAFTRAIGPARMVNRASRDPVEKLPAFAFAGIARPERFYDDLERSGWTLTGRRSFRDHHFYSASELEGIEREARSTGASLILTTEKDAVRLPRRDFVNLAVVPLTISIEPAFFVWLTERLAAARGA